MSAFPFAVLGFSIKSDVILLRLQDVEKAIIPAHKEQNCNKIFVHRGFP